MNSLNCGVYSKKSCRMNRADILSPPVKALIFASAHRRPCSTSEQITSRAPHEPSKVGRMLIDTGNGEVTLPRNGGHL
jgi:hypothetical protein